jgi:hypothetical protein
MKPLVHRLGLPGHGFVARRRERLLPDSWIEHGKIRFQHKQCASSDADHERDDEPAPVLSRLDGPLIVQFERFLQVLAGAKFTICAVDLGGPACVRVMWRL